MGIIGITSEDGELVFGKLYNISGASKEEQTFTTSDWQDNTLTISFSHQGAVFVYLKNNDGSEEIVWVAYSWSNNNLKLITTQPFDGRVVVIG